MKRFLVLFCLLSLPASAGIVKGPYLQDARTNRMTIACETDASQSCSVNWGSGLSNTASLSASGNHHEGVIEGLSPSTCYPYQLTCGADQSPQASFCTAPNPGEPFSFVLFGDTRSSHTDHQRVIDRIAAESVDFYVNTGDLVSSGEVESDWDSFFEIEGDLMRELAMYPTVGNHDEDDGNVDVYTRLFAVPTDSSGDERYYSFTYGNAHFIVLDNQSFLLGITTQTGWAEGEIDAARANPDIDHIFVMAHCNMYSSKDGRSGDWQLRYFGDTMQAKGVNMVFAGHDHYYERGEADNGLPYVIAGGGGAPLYDTENTTEGTPIDIFYPAHTIFYSKAIHHYLRIDIHGPYFNACAKDAAGAPFDCFSYGEQPQQDGGTDGGQDGGIDAGDDGGIGGDDGGAGGDDAGLPDAGDAGTDDDGCNCAGQPYDPVCGEDGKTYYNMCELDCAQAGMDHKGECQGQDCESLCPNIEDPVCGQDNQTYINPCFMECAGVPGKHEGACEDPTDCSQCPDTDDPVCGTDGKTYKNQCMLECMNIELNHTGRCKKSDDGCGCGSTDRTSLLLLPLLLLFFRRMYPGSAP